MRGGSEGPNWILLAGGAAVTALSYVIGRRQRHGFEYRVEEDEGKSGKAQLANHNDGFESEYRGTESSKACSHQDSFGSVDSSSLDNSTRSGLLTTPALVDGTSTRGLYDAFHANDHQDRHQSPPSAEFFEEERSFQRKIPSIQEDVRRSNQQGLQIVRTPKRDMVHRLRKQLKSRDEMILRMQVQISEYERSLSLSDVHVSKLQARLEETSGVLSDFDQEVLLLRNQLADHFKFDAKMEDCNQPAPGGVELTIICGDERRDMSAALLEFKKLREVLDRLKEDTAARKIEREALSQDYNSMLEKVDQLECALKEQRMLTIEKEQALDMKQVELLGVSSKLHDMQHLLQAQIEETESLRHSKEKLEACIHNLNSRGFSLRGLHSSEEIISSTSTEVSDSSSHPPDGRGDPELLDTCHEFDTDFAENINDHAVSDSMVAALQQEVNDLSVKLIELAKCKQVEEEMADIRKHQAKIAELRQELSNLTWDSIDEVRKEQPLHVATLICGLAEKLAAQEEQAKQTALEVQQLSTSFQLLTPIMTELQNRDAEMPLKGEPNPGEIHSYDVGHVKFNSSRAHPKLATQDSTNNQAGTPQPGQQGTDSSSDSSTLSSNQHSPDHMLTELVDDDYQFRVGASGPLASKIRRFSSKWDGKNGRRKKPFTHVYGGGSDTDIITSGNWATKSDGEMDLYLQERINTDVPHDNDHSLESNVEFQDLESRLMPVEEEHHSHDTWTVQQNNRYFPYEVEQVMAAITPDSEGVDFVPTLEEFSPCVRRVRSPPQGIGSSKRYLFNSGTNQGNHANSSEASSGYSVIAAESPLENSEKSFLVSEAASLSPFSKIVAQIDSIEVLFEACSLQAASVEVLLPDSPKDTVEDEIESLEEGNTPIADKAIENRSIDQSETNAPIADGLLKTQDIDEPEGNAPIVDGLIETQDIDDSVSQSGSESRGSIDSEFDEMLDGTLDDLVKIFSTTVTPASTPTSSALSQNSGSKKFQYF